MIGVLLINLGGAENQAELKQFYRRMFLDKHIIPAPYFFRNLLSLYISKTRFKTGWIRYEMIGGTPIKKDTQALVVALQSKLGNEYLVKEAYSYSNPLITETIDYFSKKNITNIIAVPLYPQASITTTSSVVADIDKIKKTHQQLKTTVLPEFFENNHFISFWTDLITKHISDNKLNKPLLIFSAHSIPLACIKKGDTYQQSIEKSAKLIAEKCNLNFCVSYQSGSNKKTWIGPETPETIESLINKGTKEIVLIPISFIGENLETLYDLDRIIVPNAQNNNSTKVSRVRIPAIHPKFLQLIEQMVKID